MNEEIKKEEKDSFDYESLWNKEEQKKEKKLIEELPKGMPRKGIKGKYIKRKNHITRNQVRGSYGSYVRTFKKEWEKV